MNFPSLRVDGRIAIVTGTGSGLGQASALALAQAGAAVVMTELPQKLAAAEATARQAAADYGANTLVLPLDLLQLDTIGALVDQAVAHFGRVDILVNNAGINIQQMALDVTEDAWDKVLDVNLKGLFFTSQAVARVMMRQGTGGKIVNIASQMGVVGYIKRAAYCSSKAGVVNLSRVLAFEWAEYGIRVNCIGPTFVETPLTAPMFEDKAFRDDVLHRIPLGRLGKPEDVVGAVVYLASPASDMVTGHTLLVDGGWTAV
jgi:2-deoxy-D-gluconate 3-dehydrogenase